MRPKMPFPSEMDVQICIAIARFLDAPLTPLQARQSGTEHQNLTMHWQKPEPNFDYPVVLPDARFGGQHHKNVAAAGDAYIAMQKELVNPRAAQAPTAECTRPMRREAEPVAIRSVASEEASISTTLQLQRPEPREASSPLKLTAPRVYEPSPSVKVTESRQVEQLNNVQLRRPEEWAQAPDHTRWEPRYGGQIIKGVKAAEEKQANVPELTLRRPEAVEAAPEAKRIIPRDTEPIGPFTCSPAGESAVQCTQTLANPLESTAPIAEKVLKDVNRGEPARLDSREIGKEEMSTNIALQSPQRGEGECEQLRVEPRYGGHYQMSCSAAGQMDTGETVIRLNKPVQEEHAGPLVIRVKL
jgi:hypothetical protein